MLPNQVCHVKKDLNQVTYVQQGGERPPNSFACGTIDQGHLPRDMVLTPSHVVAGSKTPSTPTISESCTDRVLR